MPPEDSRPATPPTGAGLAHAATGGLFESIFTTDELAAATSDHAWLQAMLDAEAALAAAGAQVGIVPPAAAESIAACCDASRFDPVDLGRRGRAAGNPVVPLVAALRVTVPAEDADWVHHGATSQDIVDTAAMLVAKRSSGLIVESVDGVADAAAALAEANRATMLAARTLLQQALPTTLGLKAAGWCMAALEAAEDLRRVRIERLAVQLGGAAGTLAALGPAGLEVADVMADRLGLRRAPLSWHTDRTRTAELAGALGVVAGVAGKIALDVALLMQTEVAEAREPAEEGRGSSSTMPHKRNPVLAASATAAVRRAHGLAGVMVSSMAQEHERAVGAWQAEWQTLTELLRAAGGAAALVRTMLEGLEVDRDRMAANLAASRGLLMSERAVSHLAERLGRVEASLVVEEASRRVASSGGTLASELAADERVAEAVPAAELAAIFDDRSYLGATDALVQRALDTWRQSRGKE